ncbi:MAG: phosphate signaling complex protein PhoU [Lachnospiraceae bacterium]|nr:phosphate signaling complex protein PhoU [Lachnospiraceae bacterium]
MRDNFERQLAELNEDLIAMGALCKAAVSESMTALLHSDRQARQRTFLLEYEIDQKERDIENRCMKLLLRQQPVARDLRTISAALKMISDMERIGDQASDIADIMKFLEGSDITQHVHIQQMAEAAMKMLTDSIESFVKKDLPLANSVMQADDLVDELFDQVKTELIQMISENPGQGEQCIDILMIAKYFERIGDHVVNIAEWVEYSVTGSHRHGEA